MRFRLVGIGLSAAVLVCAGIGLHRAVSSETSSEPRSVERARAVSAPQLPLPTVTQREPTALPAVQPLPGSEVPPLAPFEPHSPGPAPDDKSPKPLWSYDDLTPEDRAVVDRGRDVAGWSQTHDAFQKAARERAEQAAAESVARQAAAGR